jgi:hypothetical protein
VTNVRKKSLARHGSLRVSTPKDRRHQHLKEAGIIVPEEMPPDEDVVPLDFTRMSSRDIGGLQSRYAVRHAHAIWNLAVLDADLVRLKRDLRIETAKFRIRHKSELKNVVDAMIEMDMEISDILATIAEIEIKRTLVEAVTKSYSGIQAAASREISRRMGEMTSRHEP